MPGLPSFLLASGLVASSAFASPLGSVGAIHETRDTLLDSYDYIVVGGGASGLTVANRLTEDAAVTVLVIEAGQLDAGEDDIVIPSEAGTAAGGKYDWNITGNLGPILGNRTLPLTLGKAVGGSTLLNRMVFDRGSAADYNMWEALGNEGWGFPDLLPYFIKSEAFTPPEKTATQPFDIEYDASVHGTQGYVKSSFPKWIYPSVSHFIDALTSLGIWSVEDGAGGNATGQFWVPSAEDPVTQKRISARTAYYDSAVKRPNFHVLLNHQVTKINLSKNGGTRKRSEVCADGVQFQADKSSAAANITANKEVILAAGALNTPKLLQLSGIGDQASLEGLVDDIVLDLPVGFNFQDHFDVFVVYGLSNNPLSPANLTNNATFKAEAEEQYKSGQGPLTSTNAQYISFLPLPTFSDRSASIVSTGSADEPDTHLSSNYPATARAGYAKQRELIMEALLGTDAAAVEIFWADPVFVSINVKPLSRGYILINSTDPFEQPDPHWRAFTDPVDLAVLAAGMTFQRKIAATSAFMSLGPTELLPGQKVTEVAHITSSAGTVWHPVGTCPMMPKELGGVVGTDLKVYGASNLRIVDASIFPTIPATHTQATVYAVAEKAADLIKN